MKIRAVICDVYGTLLQVGPPPADAAERWRALFQETFASEPPMDLLNFSIACSRAIKLRHTAAQARGVPFPEILWPAIVAEVLPAFAKLTAPLQAEFVFQHSQLGRTINLMAGAGPTLRRLAVAGKLLGLASNAQAYTLRELKISLEAGGLTNDMFEPELCYWSYQHGFSKPDPHVFQILRIRLEARGISPGEALLVGDRLDNDIVPAQTHGFQTWHLTTPNGEKSAGDWTKLGEFLAQAI